MGNLGISLIGSVLFSGCSVGVGVGVISSPSQYNESPPVSISVWGFGTSVSTFFLNLLQYLLDDLSKKYFVVHQQQ
jgi:hypothetical protein